MSIDKFIFMGIFDIFKKKETKEDIVNNLNSVFTLRYVIPYFQIFDKTDKDLSTLPIKMAVKGSCQYKISEPDLCFDNIPLKKMSPEQIEKHVKDALSMNIKTYFNSITSIPVLQFESVIDSISDAMKGRMKEILEEEFGINLRTFHISEVRYDTEDTNYLRLQALSQKKMNHRLKRADTESEIELDELKHSSSLNKKKRESEVEQEIQSSRHGVDMDKKQREQEFEHAAELKRHQLDLQKKKDEIDLDLARKTKENAIAMEKFLYKNKEKK